MTTSTTSYARNAAAYYIEACAAIEAVPTLDGFLATELQTCSAAEAEDIRADLEAAWAEIEATTTANGAAL